MATAKIEYDGKTLAAALVAFQAELPTVTLDGTNPHFNSKFTTLTELTSKVIPALSKHDLAYTATPSVTENGLVVEGHLVHTSGERLTAQFPITETNPQKIGSALTYARRYLLAALTGVVAETDDDGNAASTATPTDRALNNARQAPASRPTAPAPSEIEKLKAKVRAYIDSSDDKDKARKNVVEIQDAIKKETGLKAGLELQKLVNQKLGL